jgi:hypothetical protein
MLTVRRATAWYLWQSRVTDVCIEHFLARAERFHLRILFDTLVVVQVQTSFQRLQSGLAVSEFCHARLYYSHSLPSLHETRQRLPLRIVPFLSNLRSNLPIGSPL